MDVEDKVEVVREWEEKDKVVVWRKIKQLRCVVRSGAEKVSWRS